MRVGRWLPWSAGLVALVGALIVTAPRGPAESPDGMSYLAAAQSLISQGTLREPFADWNAPDSTSLLADYPAGFSLILAAPLALGVPPVPAARWVEAAGIGGAVGVIVALLEAVAGVEAALAGFALLFLMPALTDLSLWILSEPLFLFVVAATLAEMIRHPERPGRAGVLAAAANLVRYAGVFLVAGAGLWAAAQPGGRRVRVLRGLRAVLPGALLHLYWAVVGIVPGGGIVASPFGGVGAALREGWETGLGWLFPGVTGSVERVAGAVLLVALGWAAWRAVKARAELRPMLVVTGGLSVLYAGTVGFARVFVIPDVPFDTRILAPLFFILTVPAAAGAGIVWKSRRALRPAVVATGLVWCALAARRDIGTVGQAWAGGLSYEGDDWQRSPVADWLRQAGRGRALYTTDPAGVWYLTGRASRLLPATLAPDSVALFRARFASSPSALVALDANFAGLASGDSLAAALGLVPAARFDHGTVWVTP